MQRVADYIVDYIYKLGVKDAFLVTGGGMMFLSDALAADTRIKKVCTHHEQAAAMAAVSYAKHRRDFGAAYVTTGCGGTNAMTGLLDAWQDNVPCFFISGQSKRKETVRNSSIPLRQFGVQEADIIALVSPITKYAVIVNEPSEIAYHFEKAAYLAKSGRPGPVWLDIPMDVQSALIDEKNLKRFSEKEVKKDYKEDPSMEELDKIRSLFENSRRPVIIAGQGIALAGAIPQFRKFIEAYEIPYVASRLGIDLLSSDHPLFIGRIGNRGDRAGNFALQNSDLVLSIGSRLSVSTTGHDYASFARGAQIAVVDIDPYEHKKKTVRIDLLINADARRFLESFVNSKPKKPDTAGWVKRCRSWKEKWPVCLPEYAREKNGINTYYFVDTLCKLMKDDAVLITDAGSAFYVVSQAVKLSEKQRFIISSSQAEMGFTLPACVGASVSRGSKEVLGITGDGSLQMNIQELQTVVHYELPIKLFVWNNDGYLSIRATQDKFFNGRHLGTDRLSGVSFPVLSKIANAYGIPYVKLEHSDSLEKDLKAVLSRKGALICELMCNPKQETVPAVSSYKKPDGTLASRPLEDMYPFIDRGELKRSMLVPPIDSER